MDIVHRLKTENSTRHTPHYMYKCSKVLHLRMGWTWNMEHIHIMHGEWWINVKKPYAFDGIWKAPTTDYDKRLLWREKDIQQMTHTFAWKQMNFPHLFPSNIIQKWTSDQPLKSVLNIRWSRVECKNKEKERKKHEKRKSEGSLTMEELKKKKRRNKTFVIRNI